MAWEVEYTEEFEHWWKGLREDEQDSIDSIVGLLEDRGPSLPFPFSSSVRGSKHGGMRELCAQHRVEPYRIFYAFDPRRAAILLLGGNKVGDDLFYERMVPVADRIYDEHLDELCREKQRPDRGG
jgi:hypothetical protein